MINPLLSQEEIDALLEGMKSGHHDAAHFSASNGANARPVDFTHHYHEYSRLPALQMINERFAHAFSTRLFNLLHKSCEISLISTKTLKFGEYVKELPTSSSLNMVQISPLRGNALFILDAKLIFGVIDLLFGGAGRYSAKIETRPFTANENRIVQILLEEIFPSMKEAWAPLLNLSYEFIKTENNPHFIPIVGLDEWVMVCRFQIKLEGGGGNFYVALPHTTLEPIRHLLDVGVRNPPLEKNEKWRKALSEQVLNAELEITSTMVEVPITIGDFLRLRPGDILPIDLSDQVTLAAAQIPVLRGKFTKSSGCNTVSVVGSLRHHELKNQKIKMEAL